jgi:prephenate dehydratase
VKQYFVSTPDLLECSSFDVLAEAIAEGKCDEAVMAIENSIAGSILPNYVLMDQYGLVIVGEHYLSIEHNLMALPGQKN